MFYLPRGHISSRYVWVLLGMPRGILLCHFGSVCSDRNLCRRNLLSSVGDRLLVLSGRNFRRNCWTECMHLLLRRIILRHGGALGSDRQLRRWKVFSSVRDSLLLMPRWRLQFNRLFFFLCELFHGHFRRDGWTECV